MRGPRCTSRRALVTGGAGQDGGYLIPHLLARGYEVHAQSRRPQDPAQHAGAVRWHVGDLKDAEFLRGLIATVRPAETYNLASVSSPTQSWKIPRETLLLNALVPQHLCELMVELCPHGRIFQASSSEIFGDCKASPQNEDTPCAPQTPYATAKLHAHHTIAAYRKHHGLHASSGIMFNHESPRRPLSYVSQKIAHAAAAVSLGLRETAEADERGQPILKDGTVRLGNLDVRRDFGFAGDYVEVIHLMLQADAGDDYVVGTGVSHSIGEFCEVAFRFAGRNWKDHVVVDRDLVRLVDSRHTVADTAKAAARFGWRPKTDFADLVGIMVEHRIGVLRTGEVEVARHGRRRRAPSDHAPPSDHIG